MDVMIQNEVKEKYTAATNNFIEKIKDDPNVIAVIVCGSLAYDVVWEKSDIDMTVIIRDQVLKSHSYCITEDDIVINVNLVLRSNFKRSFEQMTGGSFIQSYYNKGKMLYTTDDSLVEYFEEMKQMGTDDIALSILFIACELVHTLDKCMKWLYVKKDNIYAQFYLLKAVESIARMEVCLNGEPPTRECIQKAKAFRPDIITPFYEEAMSNHLSKEEIEQRISIVWEYLEKHLDVIKKPVVDFMSDGELKTLTILTKHFHTDGHFIVGIFDYLSDKGVIEKVAQTIRLTPKSKLAVEELSYLYIP